MTDQSKVDIDFIRKKLETFVIQHEARTLIDKVIREFTVMNRAHEIALNELEAKDKEISELKAENEQQRNINARQTEVFENIVASVERFMSLLDINFITHDTVEKQAEAFNEFILTTKSKVIEQDKEIEGLKQFARMVINTAFDGDICGGDIQEWGEKYGLLKEESYNPEKHGEINDCESGDRIYVFTDILKPGWNLI